MKLNQLTLWDAAFALIVVAFIVFKIPHLSLPYYWDESWSYAPALQIMAEKGPSLMPGTIPAENYRGHPTLYYALGGLWLKIFGTSVFNLHAFSMAFSVAALTTIYAFGRRFFAPIVGLSAVLMLIPQGYFLTQCSLALPEIAVMFWTILAFYFFFQNRWWAYFFAASGLVMTKESGLVLIAALLLGWLTDCLIHIRSTNFRTWLLNSCRIAAPLIPFAAFFCVQKAKMGWYFFPEHVGYMIFDYDTIVHNYAPLIFDRIFWNDERHIIRGVFLIGLLLTIGTAIWKRRTAPLKTTVLNRIFGYFVLFIIAYVFFCAMNFFTPRYVLCCLPILTLIAANTLYESTLKNTWATGFVSLGVAVYLFQWTTRQTDYGDVGWGMYDAVKMQKLTVEWFEKNTPLDTHIAANDFLVLEHLTHPKTGFLSTKNGFINTTWAIDDKTEFVVDTKITFDNRIEPLKQAGKIELIQHYQKGDFWSDIYKFKK